MSRANGNGPIIEFRNVGYHIKGSRILHDINLSIGEGETLVILGRSGSGKTSALRLINRLHEPNSGQINVFGKPTTDWDPTELRRRIGYVIQETGLFPHFTVEQNIALVPRLEKWPEDRTRARVSELLHLVDLDEKAVLQRYPHQLSGGQRQRVGVARALAADPPVLLMDEPFGALDPLTRVELEREFRQLQSRLGKTIVFVTHELRQALLLGTRIALIDAGKLIGLYTPEEFERAQEPLAAAYIAAFQAEENIAQANRTRQS